MAILFALTALPLSVLVLGGIDMQRATSEKVKVQDALDAAALLAALSGQLADDELNAVGVAAFKAQLQGSGSYAKTFTATFSNGKDDSVVGVATAQVDTIILGLLSIDYFTVGAFTEVKRRQNEKLELALVLDTTGSMSGARLTSLKKAATNLVNTLTADPKANVKIAVVPFAQYVNTGVARRNEPWMKVPADWVESVPSKCTTQTQKTTCQTQSFSCVKYNDGVPYNSTCTKNVNCVTVKLNPPVTNCTKPSTINHKYHGCTGSPAYPQNVSDSDPTRRYPGFLNMTCGSVITPLTTNMTTVKNAISALSAAGETYIPSGLAWGFNVISSPVPFTEAAPYGGGGVNSNPRKAIVLMTDGRNTKLLNKSNGRHDVNPVGVATEANKYTEEICSNMKANKIDIYTVAFQVTDSAIKKILQECASNPSYYFDASDSAGLNKAFADISLSLRSLFIAR